MNYTNHIPRDFCLDNTLKLLLEGYRFLPNRFQRYQSDLFQTRLMGKKVICMRGEKAAKLFYDNQRFTRTGAVPKRIQKTLFGLNGVQALDGNAHKHRKQLFMSFMTAEKLDQLIKITKEEWNRNSKRWEQKGSILLFDEVQVLLCQVACKWAGVPLNKSEVRLRAQDFGAMVDAFGGVGPRYWKGRCARTRTEEWAKKIIEDVRAFKKPSADDTILHSIAWHYDLNGKLLDSQVAAVEIINILRPITAIATYITFGALALKLHPECKAKLQRNEGNYAHMFVQEIRRFYPFGPFLGAKVRKDFVWMNCLFIKGTLVFLDIYGTNHDPKLWNGPYDFNPERFRYFDGNPYDFIPQGGGDSNKGHRCAGEWVTLEILKISMTYLTSQLQYEVPFQDLSFSMSRMPTLPRSRFLMINVQRIRNRKPSTGILS